MSTRSVSIRHTTVQQPALKAIQPPQSAFLAQLIADMSFQRRQSYANAYAKRGVASGNAPKINISC